MKKLFSVVSRKSLVDCSPTHDYRLTAKDVCAAGAVFLLTGCVSSFDLQGHDPKEFYAKHPVENSVETRYETHVAQFMPGMNRLTADDISALRAALRDVSPLAVESVQVQINTSQIDNSQRREHLGKLLRGMGYGRQAVFFEPSDILGANEVQIDVAYAAVVSPRCPDWRRSPVTTYSNTTQGNIGCATVTNLGLMVADPRDLERGEGDGAGSGERSYKTISTYRSGADIGAPESGGGVSASSGAGATGASAGQ